MAFVAEIEGRKVYLFTGQKSQTVRVCDERNRPGFYDWVVRVAAPSRVTEGEITAQETVSGLVGWLQTTRSGAVEVEPSDQLGPPLVPPDRVVRPTPNDHWIADADRLVRTAIDHLLNEFVRAPYLHRVEHSLHTQLATLLTATPLLGRECSLGGGHSLTQPVHKEWPETKPEEGARRGNFDLAVLTPDTLGRASIEQFRKGYIEAPIVVELGLDYGLAHLAQDAEKLLNSEVQRGYLVHFTRLGHDGRVEQYIRSLIADTPVAVAYASVGPAGVRLKRLDDPAISP